ncbi:MAG: cupin domain-containing protein [Alphaproteobacteria bacterium]
MKIIKIGSVSSAKGLSDYFTGSVRIDNAFTPPEPARVSFAHVTFEPNARTAWHTHPYGQTIIITFGKGWVQKEDEPRQEVTAGDMVYFEPNERHWHGATDSTAMSHYAIQESKGGLPVTWQEHVNEQDYKNG